MADPVYLSRFENGQDRFYINTGRCQQSLTQADSKFRDLTPEVGVFHIENLPYKGVPIGMDTAGRKCKQYITGADAGFIENFCFIHNTDGKARQIIVIRLHGSGMLGGLAANESAAGLNAAFCHA